MRFKQLSNGGRQAVVGLNPEKKSEGLIWHPDSAPSGWWEQLHEGDEISVLIREKSDRFENTFIGNCSSPEDQPNKLKTALRNRQRGQRDLKRSDIMLPPEYAEALQHVRRAVGDPDTITYASRIVMAHLGPVVASLNTQGAQKNG
ncbi:hypothetical protein [Synechococcus sp. MIT S9509]|uniref:hypothetical protein n=1 Tax=Synechococcus sp. MIT S9509 TaxID=1801630 RepID=UPI00082BE656|nr:hypothetical protein [Synechococcus sp. MIT S9509]